MNPAEQKQRKKRTDELEQMITDLGTVVYARIDKAAHHADHVTREAVSKETSRRMEMMGKQKKYIDDENDRLLDQITAVGANLGEFKRRTFWQRLKWLLAGEEV